MHLALPRSWLLPFVVFIIIIKGWVVIATFLNVRIFLVSGLILVYLFKFKFYLRKPSYVFLLLYFIGPLIVDLLSTRFVFSRYAEILLLFAIWNVGVFFRKHQFLKITLNFSILFTTILAFLSIFAPEYFEDYASASDSLSFYNFRAFGLYLQPNSLAMALNFILIPWHRHSSKNIFVLLAAIVAITAAASRIGIFFGFVHLMYFLFGRLQHTKISKKGLLLLVRNILIIVVITNIILNHLNVEMFEEVLRRLSFFLEMDFQSDGSLNDRMSYQNQYVKFLKSRPLLGYGFMGGRELIEMGYIHDVSHSLHYDTLLSGGALNYIFLLAFLVALFLEGKTLFIRWWWVMFIVYSFFSSTLIVERIVFLSLGLLYNED